MRASRSGGASCSATPHQPPRLQRPTLPAAIPHAHLRGRVERLAGIIRAGEHALSARAAATNMPFVTSRAPEAMTPSPTPGKMNMLLHCPIGIVRPAYATSANGLPVAMIARPSVHAIKSAGVASLFDGGLESGKMIGRWVERAISRTIDSLKAPGIAAVPMRTVGCTARTTSSSVKNARAQLHPSQTTRLYGCATCRLDGVEIAATIVYQPVAIHQPDAWRAHQAGASPPQPLRPQPARRCLSRLSQRRVRRCVAPAGLNRQIIAASRPASVTAPVPWMSSLKERTSCGSGPAAAGHCLWRSPPTAVPHRGRCG